MNHPTNAPSLPSQPASRAGTVWLSALLFGALSFSVGCASYNARKQLEGVAKNWCETIRASQVIPVYPLTEDLTPGDVFLVQRPIATEAKAYSARGFLALDDRRTRLKDLEYGRVYFDGYWAWATNYGQTPHAVVQRSGAGPVTVPTDGTTHGTSASIALTTTMPAPRAAFPTYSFQAQSGGGLSLAIPIQGIPVALNYLQSDRVSGSVTISDASTYGTDEQQLYAALQQWAQEDDVQRVLDETVQRAGKQPIYLRVVSRVYLSGGVLVSLSRSGSLGAQAKAGFSPPNVSVVDDQGDVRANYTNLLNTLTTTANPSLAILTNLPPGATSSLQNLFAVGATAQFVAASASSVAMQESFDRPLAIGYLGFDVPVYPGGVLGAPLPTFQRLNGTVADPPRTRVGPLTAAQNRLRINLAALEALLNSNPQAGLKVMAGTVRRLSDKRFTPVAQQCESALQAPADQVPGQAQTAFEAFDFAAKQYASVGGSTGLNYQRFDTAFARAYDERDQE